MVMKHPIVGDVGTGEWVGNFELSTVCRRKLKDGFLEKKKVLLSGAVVYNKQNYDKEKVKN